MGSASLLLFAVGLSLINVAVMVTMEEVVDFLDDLGNEPPADGSGASSSHPHQKSVMSRYRNYQLALMQEPAYAICKKLNHLEIIGFSLSAKNSARAVGCDKLAHAMDVDITKGVMDAFTFVQAIGETDIGEGTANDEQCSNRNTRQFANGYERGKFSNSINFRRTVYDVCQTVHEATVVIPITDENVSRTRGCICASKLRRALTSSTVGIYTIPITEVVVYDYLEEMGAFVAAGYDHGSIFNSYNGDHWMQMTLSTGAFQNVCSNLASHGQGHGERHQARLTACYGLFPQ